MNKLLILVLLSLVGGGTRAAAQQARPRGPKPHRVARPVVIPSRPIFCDTASTAQLGLDSLVLAEVRQSRARFLLVHGGYILLCRHSPADTVWTRIRVPQRRLWDQEPIYVNEYDLESFRDLTRLYGSQYNYVPSDRDNFAQLDTCNMDQQGMPEVRLTCWSFERNKSSINTKIIHLLDVSQAPRLLLTALVQVDYGVHFTNRPVRFGRELRIGASSGDQKLTPLMPGRYQYRNGHLVWVGK
ncbi:hypothetical protein [Hymenobacter properus]|uniref:Uncharacterized protein n=1 Tax=Hymenobacter properus TaxID=2791026 RepID=A0A931BHP8_9BACT|nr:hypothetical protein [Hymenobacter properus]MBF9141791.1 hypothetical protein [Hymenobacter properus]MBR7720599.1 hypothetical protein [Microvirga sp. SRT04]